MQPVGFTTGSFYKQQIPLIEVIAKFHLIGASAIEIRVNELLSFEVTAELANLVRKFRFVSLHLPLNIIFGADDEKEIAKLKQLCSQLPIMAIVVHADKIIDFASMHDSGLPFAIENTDKRCTTGRDPEFFRKLNEKYNFRYVLDLQHCYEYDNSMKAFNEFLKVMQGKISHIHVSGESENNRHEFVSLATNGSQILDALSKITNVPIILEGVSNQQPNEYEKELDYINKKIGL